MVLLQKREKKSQMNEEKLMKYFLWSGNDRKGYCSLWLIKFQAMIFLEAVINILHSY